MGIDPKKVEDIFQAALEIEAGDAREAYLKQVCGEDEALRQRVEALLQSHDEAHSFLEQPVLENSPTQWMSEITETPGTSIGRYKLLQKIGEGGFGVVYMAEQQEPVRRKVALKIIKLGMDTKQVIARFEAERQALALMDHPNIAHVLDAGSTEAGRPYFVMELVKGIPITEYCDRHRLTTPDRLKLFVDVCRAVQHAHQKGIIHRDIKPNNVLVTLHDSTPVPKIIDFGIAKATSQRLTEKTLFTEFGLFIGTPEYMSPDQAAISGLEVDTRTDIYSLGVLLYELLTGSTPFDPDSLRTASYAEIMHMIRDVEPPRPSTRLDTLLQTDEQIAEVRHTEPAALSRLMRGDLDWIVMKAMEKDRTRRYETALELAQDVQRYMRNETVEATPPSLRYRLRKFIRRHRVGVAAGGAVAAAVFVGLFLAAFGLWQSHQEAQRSQRIADFLGDMFISTNADRAIARGVDSEHVVETARELFGDDHKSLAALLTSRAVQLQSSGQLEEAEVLYEEALEIWREFEGGEGINLADTYRGLGSLKKTSGDQEGAVRAFREAIRLSRATGKPTLTLAETLGYLGEALSNLGEYEEAIACMEEAIAIRREIAPEQKLQLAIVLNGLANLLVVSGRDGAEEALDATIEGWRHALPESSAVMAQVLTQSGVWYFTNSRQAKAESCWGEAMTIYAALAEPPQMGYYSALQGSGVILERRDEYGPAADLFRQAVDLGMQIEDLTPETCCGNGVTEQAMKQLRRSVWRVARNPELEPAAYESAVAGARKYVSLKKETSVQNSLGVSLFRLGRYEEAIEALSVSDAHYTQDSEGVPYDVAFLAMAHLKLGDTEKAWQDYDRLQRIMDTARYAESEDARKVADEAEAAFASVRRTATP